MEHVPKLQVTLLTGRTIDQGVGKEQGKTSKKYLDNVSICYIDPEDLKKLGTKDKTTVRVSTNNGSILLKGLKSPRGPHPGVIFIPYGPWANVLVSPKTESIGMPSLKGIPAEIEPSPQNTVLTLERLLQQQFRKE